MFQFLIGSLGTVKPIGQLFILVLFQFLIGSLGTILRANLQAPDLLSFNSL